MLSKKRARTKENHIMCLGPYKFFYIKNEKTYKVINTSCWVGEMSGRWGLGRKNKKGQGDGAPTVIMSVLVA